MRRYIAILKAKYWAIMSRFKNKQAVFLDTNMIVAEKNRIDKRLSKFTKRESYFITDTVAKEVSDLEKGLTRIFNYNYEKISFIKLRESFPDICPVYYNLITQMYNPANIASPEFYLQLIQSLKLRGRELSETDNRIYGNYMDGLKKGAESKLDSSGKPKTALSENMDIGSFQYFKKKITNRNSENLLNDYKNISLIILYGLLTNSNTIFITSDRDILAIILVLAESLAQDVTLPNFYLKSLSTQDREDLFKDKRVTKYINFKEFEKYYDGVLGDIINPFWQKQHISFTVRFWDEKRQAYVEDLVINFDINLKGLILHAHGPLSCPFAKNDTHGNWAHCLYWPPAQTTPNIFKVVLSKKKIFNRKNTYVPDAMHQFHCKYANDDRNNKLKEYFGFRL